MKQPSKKWVPNSYRIAQKKNEFTAMLNLIAEKKTKTYLEIGARHGGAFYEVVTKTLPKDALAVAVDLPGGAWGQEESSQSLLRCIEDLRQQGWENVHVIFGDSTSEETLKKIVDFSEKYDSIFIDGDHRYLGCKSDWDMYSPLATQLVFFHDIDGVGITQKSNPRLKVEVPKLWNELKETHKTVEFIDSINEPDRPMGIGCVLLGE